MSNNRNVIGRIQHKHDTEAHWKSASGFSPRAGELIVYDPDTTINHHRIKIGDGNTNVNTLPFLTVATSGEGNRSVVVNNGTAVGAYSLAGGTNDSSLIKNIISIDVNSITDDMIKEELGERGIFIKNKSNEPSEAIGEMSVAYGVGNQSLTAASNTYGIANQAGSRGLYIHKVVVNGDNTISIYLSGKKNSSGKYVQAPYYKYLWDRNKDQEWSTSGAAYEQLDYLSVGDKVTILLLSLAAVIAGEITKVEKDKGIITISNEVGWTQDDISAETIFSASQIEEAAKMALLSPSDFSVSFPYKPHVGCVDITFGGTAFGVGNSAKGNASFITGIANTACGVASFVSGRENIGSFASLVGGYKNTVSGSSAFSSGLSNTVSGDASGAIGSINTVSGERSFAAGGSNIVSDNYAFAGGLSSEATAKYAFAFGHVAKATFASQAVVGRYNIIDTDKAFIVGVGTSSTPKNALAVSWSGDTSIHRHLNVGKNATVDGELTVEGNSTFKTSVEIKGNSTLTGALTVSGYSTFTDGVEIQGQLQLHGNAKIDDADIITSADTDMIVSKAVKKCNKDLSSATGIDYATKYLTNKTYNKLPCITSVHTGEAGMIGPVPATYHIAQHKRYNLLPHYRCTDPFAETYTYTSNGGTFESTPDGKIHVSGTFTKGTYYIMSTGSHTSTPRRMILPPGTYAFHNCYAQYRVLDHDPELDLYKFVSNVREVKSMSGMKLETFSAPVILERLALYFANGTTVDDYFVPFICVADGRQDDIKILNDGIYIKGKKVSAAEFYCPRIEAVSAGAGEEQEITLPASNYQVESDINPICRLSMYGDYELSEDGIEYIDLNCFMAYASAIVEESVTFKKLIENEYRKRIYSGPTLPDDSIGENGDLYIMY